MYAVSCKKAKRVTVLSQQDKYRKASHITTKLASLVSEAPMREFKQKLSTLEDILKVWEQGGRCTYQGQLYVAYYIIYGVIVIVIVIVMITWYLCNNNIIVIEDKEIVICIICFYNCNRICFNYNVLLH